MRRRETQSNIFICGNARFSVINASVIRMEYSPERGFIDESSLLAFARTTTPCEITCENKSSGLTLTTPNITLTYINDGAAFSKKNVSVRWSAGGKKGTWRPGMTPAQPLGGTQHALDAWPKNEKEFAAPGILNRGGWHLLDDAGRNYFDKKGDLRSRGGAIGGLWREAIDWYFFAYGCDYRAALQSFVDVCGRIPMIPRWAFGFWYSRYFNYTAADFIALADKYRAQGFPLDVMVVDTDWRRDGWRGYDWSLKQFPKPRRFFDAMRAKHIHTTLNDHPGYGECDPLPDDDAAIPALKKELGAGARGPKGWACFWALPEYVRAWKSVLLKPMFETGMDFWWVDGWARADYPGVHSQVVLNHHYYAAREEQTNQRGLILSRFGGLGAHRYPVNFSGDTLCNWETLQFQTRFTAESGAAGACYWSHDIGGFLDKKIPEELFIRWVQFGAFSPIFRTHSAFGFREPWHFSDRAAAIFKKYLRLRYALVPYIYASSRAAYDKGLPLCRPMYLQYPRDDAAYEYPHQYFFGENILVAPATAPCDDGKSYASKKVWFPAGTWINPETGHTVAGPRELTLKIPLDIIPFYVRSGSILPLEPVGEYIPSRRAGELTLQIYPDAVMRGCLYEDDGETLAYKKGKCAEIIIDGAAENDTLKLTAQGLPDGAPIHFEVIGNPYALTLNGRSLPRMGTTQKIFHSELMTPLRTELFVTD